MRTGAKLDKPDKNTKMTAFFCALGSELFLSFGDLRVSFYTKILLQIRFGRLMRFICAPGCKVG